MKFNMKKVLLMVLAISMVPILAIPRARAHNLWIGVDHYDFKVGETARVFLYLAHSLPFADFARPERMKEFIYLTPSGKKKRLVSRSPDPKSFFNEVSFPLSIEEEGTYVAAVAMEPVFVTLTPEGRKRQSKINLPDAINCRHVEFSSKAFFYAGRPKGQSYKRILGHALEAIPQVDPCIIKVGEYLPLKVLFKGKPLAGQFVYATYVGFSTREDYALATKTDGKGLARIKILKPGIWWVKIPYKEPHKDKTECDVDQYATILTFEVK